MKLKDLSVNFKLVSKFFLVIKNAKFVNDYFLLVDDKMFFSVIQAKFGDLEIFGIDVLDYVYVTILLDSDLFVEFKNLLEKRGF
mgnify:CR=1 FL=1